MTSDTEIQFINHASLVVKQGDISLLSDPWYQGDAFHKGWSLIHELQDADIDSLLNTISHIWISHEHPDHFSISFFKKFGNAIKEREIKVLFQSARDQRVETFLARSNFDVGILEFNRWTALSEDFKILCFKDGFYDSGLVIKTPDKTILNLNDCEIKDRKRCEEVLALAGKCDVLASQFSYAAWKGGIDNTQWRKLAAKEKLNTLKLQAEYFEPKAVIPFASFAYFSNENNDYLNDASNTPNDVVKAFTSLAADVKVMKPFDILSDLSRNFDNDIALKFWAEARQALEKKPRKKFDVIPLRDLEKSFGSYRSRIFKNNTMWFMKFVRTFSPIPAFKPVNIYLSDLGETVTLDLFSENLKKSSCEADLKMSSESMSFLLGNTFGFDTLTVNGCFEEKTKSGFSRAARTLAIENMNNMGFEFRPWILFNWNLIALFLKRLWNVSEKIKLSNS